MRQDYFNISLSNDECKVLLKVLENEWDRWKVLINLNRASGGNPSIAADYELDSIVLDDLIVDFEFKRNEKTSVQFSFDYREAAFLIAALDHDLEMALSKKFKEIACEKFGDDVLTFGHYQRGKNS